MLPLKRVAIEMKGVSQIAYEVSQRQALEELADVVAKFGSKKKKVNGSGRKDKHEKKKKSLPSIQIQESTSEVP